MMLNYLIGNALKPEVEGPKIIAHITNDVGGWGSGFVVEISKLWKAPEEAYRSSPHRKLGFCQLVKVEPDKYVMNMCAQHGYRTASNPCPLDYNALEKCLIHLSVSARLLRATIHMPRIGCARGGGNWNKVEDLISKTLIDKGLEVYVYNLPAKR